MTKKGRLSLVEKAAIQTFIGKGDSIQKTAKTLDRTVAVVKRYVESELDDLHSVIVKAQLEAVKADGKKGNESQLSHGDPPRPTASRLEVMLDLSR